MSKLRHIAESIIVGTGFVIFVLLLLWTFNAQRSSTSSPSQVATSHPLTTPQLTLLPSIVPLASPTVVALPTTSPAIPSPTATRFRAENIHVTGERPIDPTGNAIFLGWSPKGDKLLFRKSLSTYVYSKVQNALIGDLWVMDVNGGSRRLIAKTVGSWSWSPDGRYLVYSAPTQTEGTQGVLYIVDTTIFQEKKLTAITFTTVPEPQWLPTGEVTFLRNGYMFAIRPDGTGERQLNTIYLNPPGLVDLNNQPRIMGIYVLSPKGTRIAYWTQTFEDSPLWLANLDGSNAIKIANRGSAYTWSPDGETLVLAQAQAKQRNAEIWLVDADGTNFRRLVAPPYDLEFIWDPTWSPDGQALAYIRAYQPPYDVRTPGPIPPVKYELWVINRDGTQSRMLYDKAGDGDLRWAPSGLAIAFNRRVNPKPDSTPTQWNAFLVTLSLTQ